MNKVLQILARGGERVRCEVEKWTFRDRFMGEQSIIFSVQSALPIPFEIGDYCVFRGETFTLNYIPTCVQNAKYYEAGDAFSYEDVKLNSAADDLTRCEMLDVVLTSAEHSAAYGTNYTGSNNFTLDCFETTFEYQGETKYYCPARVLADCILANLVRLYGTTDGLPYDGTNSKWKIYMDDSKCHSDDKIVSLNAWTASQALAEINNTFKLDYVVRGRNIIIGDVSELTSTYSELSDLIIGNLTDVDGDGDLFYFGYGKGNNSEGDDGRGLFQIKRVANSEQQIVTRLRAMGSTKNMPYRYYNKNYALPQTMFVSNLQLPQTFLPYDGTAEKKPADEYKNKKDGNEARDKIYDYEADGVTPTGHYATDGIHNLRHVLGDSNDAYIDKDDDAARCAEGIREASAKWDGSDSELPEIYPTIKEGTYKQLRANNIPDQDRNKGQGAFPLYGDDERIDELLDVGPLCNYGDGISPEDGEIDTTSVKVETEVSAFTRTLNSANIRLGDSYTGTLFSIDDVQDPGSYIYGITTTQIRWAGEVKFQYKKKTQTSTPYARVSLGISIIINAIRNRDNAITEVCRYSQTKTLISSKDKPADSDYETQTFDITIPNFASGEGAWNNDRIEVSERSHIECTLRLSLVGTNNEKALPYSCTHKLIVTDSENTKANIIWKPYEAENTYLNTPFTLFVKDFGVDFTAMEPLNDEEMVISMMSGQCMGRDFSVDLSETKKAVVNGKKCYELQCKRANDESLGAYFPSENNKILPGDRFVVTGINLPDAYIRMAEVRLLEAATEYLADNSETKFTYMPMVDNVYLQRDIDKCEKNGDITKSIYWRLYSGMRFAFRGIPQSDNILDPLPIINITIEQVSITLGEDETPHVEVTLNSDIEQSTTQKIQTSIDRIYGSIFSSGSAGSSSAYNSMFLQLLQTEGEKRFISKIKEDTANEQIQFSKGVTGGPYAAGFTGAAILQDDSGNWLHEGDAAKMRKSVTTPTLIADIVRNSGEAIAGLFGSGYILKQDVDGVSTLDVDKLTVRQTMRIMELLIDKVRSTGGTVVISPANGKIKEVSEDNGVYSITFENGNEFVAGDLLRCATFNGRNLKSYWVEVSGLTDDGKGVLVNASEFADEIPEAGDECVQMGNATDTSRQGIIVLSASEGDNGKPMINVLDKVQTKNFYGCLRARLGSLDDIYDTYFGEEQPQGYGLYSDNAYLKGKFVLHNGDDIGVKFNILEDRVSSTVQGGIQMLQNGDFSEGIGFWEIANDTAGVAYRGDVEDIDMIWFNGNNIVLSSKPSFKIEDVYGRLTLHTTQRTSYSEDYMINKPEDHAKVTLSFWARTDGGQSLTVSCCGVDETIELSSQEWTKVTREYEWHSGSVLEFVPDNDMYLSGVNFYVPSSSLIEQTAESIRLQLNDTGINIEDKKITLNAETTEVSENLVVNRLMTNPTDGNAHIEAAGSLMKVFGLNSEQPNIVFGFDSNGYAVLKYYDNNGNFLYDLGPNGIRKAIAGGGTLFGDTVYENTSNSGEPSISDTPTTIYQYLSEKNATGDFVMDSYNVINGTDKVIATATACDGKWFTSGEEPDNTDILTYDDEESAYINIVTASFGEKIETISEVDYYAVGLVYPKIDPSTGTQYTEGYSEFCDAVDELLAKTGFNGATIDSDIIYNGVIISGTADEKCRLSVAISVYDVFSIANGVRTAPVREWWQGAKKAHKDVE